MKALLLIDIQNDFVPGGNLAVNEGNKIVPIINQLMDQDWDLIVATKDWHPKDHGSFASNHPGKQTGELIDLNGLQQILWPDHCIQDSKGSEFVPGLKTGKIDKIIYKGTDPSIDSYSAFFDNGKKKSTGLADYLKEKGIDEVYVVGLATDYCVLFSVLDACGENFKTTVIQDACRGVELKPGDCQSAIAQMENAGARIVNSDDLLVG